MRRWLKLVPVAMMGVLAVAYVLVRPTLAQRVEHLAILEFPVGALVIGALLWAALAQRPPAPPAPWRRHEQVVRPVPDPALAAYLAPLERWVETGEGAQDAATVLAKARAADATEQARLRDAYLSEMTVKASRRKRESMLKKNLEPGA